MRAGGWAAEKWMVVPETLKGFRSGLNFSWIYLLTTYNPRCFFECRKEDEGTVSIEDRNPVTGFLLLLSVQKS